MTDESFRCEGCGGLLETAESECMNCTATLDRTVSRMSPKGGLLTLLDAFSIVLTVIIYLQVFRSFFIRTREEAMMFKLIAESFSFAPLAYLLSLAVSILKKRNGNSSFGLAEAALFTTLPLVGIFAVIHSPTWDGVNLTGRLLIGAAAFSLPSIPALVILTWLGRHHATKNRENRGQI